VGPALYYARELGRRLEHYAERRLWRYVDHGSLEAAAEAILSERARNGFRAGGHFDGVWPRDLCFSARGLVAAGYGEELRTVGSRLLARTARKERFYTDFHDGFAAATPGEGVDTFSALVLLLAEAGGLSDHADDVATLAALHRERFLDEDAGIVAGAGSSWWDSAARPREAYETAMLLAAVERLEERDLATVYTGRGTELRAGLETLWNGQFFDERRRSPVLACDANVVPLYFGLVDDGRAERIAESLDALRTEHGLRMRERPFSVREIHPFFALHRDYHFGVWPWNSFTYANGLARYGLGRRAEREVERVERRLRPYGTFLETLGPDGRAYAKRGYASAGDFTVAAALWTEYRLRTGDPPAFVRRESG
jgi:hypothetical protein